MTETTADLAATEEYPSLLRRVQASFIDGIFSFILAGCLVALTNSIDENSSWMKIAALIIGLSYEPFMSCYSRTIGQRITNMRVISVDGSKLTLYSTYLRYVVKAALGWVSFLTIHTNPRRRAIHDLAASTVMIHNS